MSHVLNFEGYDNLYPNATMEDAHVPPPHPVSRCEYGEEAHVKQSRPLSTVAHAYYCCRYTVVSV
jgi:hypothetical protein